MADNIVPWPGDTILPTTPDDILAKAKDWGMEHCIVIGETADGELVFGGSNCNAAWINFILDRAKKMNIDNVMARAGAEV